MIRWQKTKGITRCLCVVSVAFVGDLTKMITNDKKVMLIVGEHTRAIVDFRNNTVRGLHRAGDAKAYTKQLKQYIRGG